MTRGVARQRSVTGEVAELARSEHGKRSDEKRLHDKRRRLDVHFKTRDAGSTPAVKKLVGV